MALTEMGEHHAQQIKLFRERTGSLSNLLATHGVTEVIFSGTMMTQSAGTPVLFAPLRTAKRLKPKQIVAGPVPYAVMYADGDVRLIHAKTTLRAGVYLLVFEESKKGWDTRIVSASDHTVATVSTRHMAFARGKKDDLKEKAKELLKKSGLDIRIVDIEIEFNGSTEVFVSFLFWRWSLFEDPPLPY